MSMEVRILEFFVFLNFPVKSVLNTICLIKAQLNKDNFNVKLKSVLNIILPIEAQLKLLNNNCCASVREHLSFND
jgi:hypothetical protein